MKGKQIAINRVLSDSVKNEREEVHIEVRKSKFEQDLMNNVALDDIIVKDIVEDMSTPVKEMCTPYGDLSTGDDTMSVAIEIMNNAVSFEGSSRNRMILENMNSNMSTPTEVMSAINFAIDTADVCVVGMEGGHTININHKNSDDLDIIDDIVLDDRHTCLGAIIGEDEFVIHSGTMQ